MPLKLTMDDIINSESYQSEPSVSINTPVYKQSMGSFANNNPPPQSVQINKTNLEKDIYAASNRKFFSSSAVNHVYSPVREEADYLHTVEKAKEMMFAMSGLPPGFVISRTWKSVYVDPANNTNLWLEKSKKEGNSILLRGICSVPIKSSACTVPEIVKWLIAEDLITGIEGLSYRSEVVEKISNESEFIMVRRMFCKSGFISSKREFTLVTSITANAADGSYIMATRSVASDFIAKPKGSKSSHSSSSASSSSSSGIIRAIVHGSGYIIRPSSSSSHSVDLVVGAYVDLMGSKSSRINASKADLLVAATMRTIKRIQHGCADAFCPDQLLGPPRRNPNPNHESSEQSVRARYPSHFSSEQTPSTDKDADSNNSDEDLGNSNSSSNALAVMDPQIDLSAEQKEGLLRLADSAMHKLRQLHGLVNSSDGGGADRLGYEQIYRRDAWETFHEEDGITLRELSMDSSPVGVLSASCSIEAPCSLVRRNLIEQPEALDGVLEGRSDCMHLTPAVYVQWLAYGAIYPSAARDFLLVTKEEEGRGSFAIASTSIDELCEMTLDGLSSSSKSSQSSGSAGSNFLNKGSNDGYVRSALRLAGYVGSAREASPSSSGDNGSRASTDLTLVVDLSGSHDQSTPGWLIQLLLQYGLVEMMRRIRSSAEAASRRGPGGAEAGTGGSKGSAVTNMPASSNAGLGPDLTRILANIQSREARMSQFMEDGGRPTPFPSPVRYPLTQQSPMRKGDPRGQYSDPEPSSSSHPSHLDRLRSLSFSYSSSNSGGNAVGNAARGSRPPLSGRDPRNGPAATRSLTPAGTSKQAGHSFDLQSSSKSRSDSYCSDSGPSESTNALTPQSLPQLVLPSSVKKSISLSDMDGSLTPSGLVLSSAQSNTLLQRRANRAPSDDLSVEGDGSSVGGSQQLAPVPESLLLTDKNGKSKGSLGLAGATLAFEALRKFRLYLGLDPSRAAHVSEMGVDWQLKVAKPSINVFTTMIAGNSWQAIKAVTVMRADKMSIVKLLTNDSRLGEYDDMFDFATFISKVDDETSIRRICFKGVWPTAPRDFVLCTTWQEQQDGTVFIASMSADDSLCAPQKGYVRGSIQISGYFIEPYSASRAVTVELCSSLSAPALSTAISPGECKVTLVAHTELGGSLPASVINMLSTQAPVKMLAAIGDIVKKAT